MTKSFPIKAEMMDAFFGEGFSVGKMVCRDCDHKWYAACHVMTDGHTTHKCPYCKKRKGRFDLNTMHRPNIHKMLAKPSQRGSTR